ncbi:PhnD/SsuA/transferrin family substrate-binding protein [Rheinheimera sp. 4Y26]|uniref:PhnD/SsuA/transferrin family substrate-binding protein n=1 Tax=Rheinheimera sp. 4Y26 TaxID=2977811 RepID=UPI0021B11B1F|nr:PhnD/SsuA/transferrin family substrate-binding protein [Rheinheimera sp. 4Y26]MCT6698293.1 PhnD/SsuA/transferrin family substrate-binding protein [Rheinheimera sp. 4Y26]
MPLPLMSLCFALLLQPLRCILWPLLLCCAFFSLQGHSKPLVVATYAYPDINRQAAVTPLANWLAAQQQQQVTVIVANKPEELVKLAVQGKADLVVPNLVAYLQIQQQNKTMLNFLVPAGQQTQQQAVYTSSVLGKNVTDFQQLKLLLQQGRPLTVFAVWPDSASGGLIGTAALKQQLAGQFSTLTFDYVGSHQAVLPALATSGQGLGIVATATLPAQLPAGVSEIWRSAELPFGALLCNSQTLPCNQLSQQLSKSPQAAAVLQGLQQGWAEFGQSTILAPVDETLYQPLRGLLSTGSAH